MSGSATRDWDAGTYDRVSKPQQDWAGAVVDRLGLRGDETVLDAGCGSGRVTQLLLDRLPEGRVIAVDGSAAMVAEARTSPRPGADDVHPLRPRRTRTRRARSTRSSATPSSTGSWTTSVSSAALPPPSSPGAVWRLSAEAPATSPASMRRLARSPPSRACRRSRPTTPIDSRTPARPRRSSRRPDSRRSNAGWYRGRSGPPSRVEFIRTVCLGPHLDLLPEGKRAAYLDAVLERLGPDPELDYVRLNISARKRAAPAS